MEVFEKCQSPFGETSDKYKKRGEIALVSRPVEFGGKTYRQIVFQKTFLGKVKEKMTGILFATEDGQIVDNTTVKREIGDMVYQFQNIFDYKHIDKLSKTISSEEEKVREKEDLNLMLEALEKLKIEGIEGIDMIVTVMTKLPQIKMENDKAIEEFIAKVDKYQSEDIIITRDMIEDVKFSYRSILIKNFQRVKLINKGRYFYDNVVKETKSRRKKISNRISGFDLYFGMQKLGDQMDRFKKILTMYTKITDMSEDEYIRYLKEMDKTNLSERLILERK